MVQSEVPLNQFLNAALLYGGQRLVPRIHFSSTLPLDAAPSLEADKRYRTALLAGFRNSRNGLSGLDARTPL
jgi:hypothetical protein